MDKQKTGQFLKQTRQSKKLTQKQLAALLFVSDKAVSRWETGNSFPDVSLLLRLAQVLSLRVTDILRGECTPTDTENEAVLTEVLGEATVQQSRLKQQIKLVLTCFPLAVTALLAGGFFTIASVLPIIASEPNIQEAQLTLGWVLFVCLILLATVVVPILAVCFAWRIRMSVRSKGVKLLCTAVMASTLLWLILYWVRVLLSN